MNNTMNTQSGERLSFFKLFSEKKYRILIPIIQRDYAQGRKTTKEVRDTFLDALYKYLDENKPNRDLDFIYGSLNETARMTDFIPLDGQQRLTTLFLLHWYLYQISDDSKNKEKFKNLILKDDKSMFTYETRSSSSEFCDALMCSIIDFDHLLEADKDLDENTLENELSKTIKNCEWFYLSWQYDPTIQSMLTMLDAIHYKFTGKRVYFERLLDDENPIITFLFLNLKDFKLTDDLYIKMNSRGKPLTTFENFKAKFEQYLKILNPDRKFHLTFNNISKDVSLEQYFSYNIDTKWANLFWNYRTLHNTSKSENEEKDETFDEELMNFIRVVISSQYAIDTDVLLKGKDDTLEYLLGTNVGKKIKGYSDKISFYKYEELKALTQGSVLFLIDAFDMLVNGNEKIKVRLPQEYQFYFNENTVFENVLKHNLTNQERLCLHAYIRYLIQNPEDRSGIGEWMRVIHNLTHPENTVIDTASEVAAAVKSIEGLLSQSNDILNYLKQNPPITQFSTWQVLEEKIKAHLIVRNEQWKNQVEKIEKHKYFNGQIGFILEFSGILEYYNLHTNCNWNEEEDVEYFHLFADFADKAGILFDESYDNRKNDKDFVFERAVLTKGNYLTDASQYRKNLLSTNVVKNNIKRDHSWKRFFRISDEHVKAPKRQFVKALFEDSRLDISNPINSLEAICTDRTNTWRDYLIDCPDLIRYCRQGFIRFENKDNIRLYGESQSNHMHVEMYMYYLWKKDIEPYKDSFQPFRQIIYYDVKSIEDFPCILLHDFCYNKIKYQIELYYDYDTQGNYQILFRKSSNGHEIENYKDDIKTVLQEYNFIWDDKYYSYRAKTRNELMDKLREFVRCLNELYSGFYNLDDKYLPNRL